MRGDVWILAEQYNGKILRVSHELIARALPLAEKLGAKVRAVLMGHNIDETALNELVLRGADTVYFFDAPELALFRPGPYTECLAELARREYPEIILAGATADGRTLAACAAAELGTGLTADCTELDIDEKTGLLLQTRPAIGGNIMATIVCPENKPQMATVRPHSAKPAQIHHSRTGEILRIQPPVQLMPDMEIIKRTENGEESSIQDAEIIVCAGRGIKRPENLGKIAKFAEKLGAALGATREVVDRGWLPYPHQIGLSGKTVNPKVYIALGVSGAIQHLAGMQTAGKIIAVNTDPDAPIFKVADLAVVGDVFEVLPGLEV